MINLFFSYSHKDESLRNELDKHLTILKRQRIISAWHDRCITAGSEFNTEISNYLKNAQIILLLISSDFLVSDYCYDNEMKLAMGMHESGQAVIIPVILRPCDWKSTEFGKLLATPKDGKPVVKHASLDEAFLEITNEIKRVIQSISPANKSTDIDDVKNENTFTSLPRSSNLKIKKDFSDHDKDKFLDEAFGYIANYFEGSLVELKKRNTNVDFRYNRIDSQTFTASIYIDGKAKTECKISYGNTMGFSKAIIYSHTTSLNHNSFNEAFSVADDGYNLYLRPTGMSMMSRQKNDTLTFEGAAEYYWNMVIEPLQRN